LLSEHAVLRLEILDHLALLLVNPGREGAKEQLERMREQRHEPSV
jgi:hypothetical protein